MDQAYDFHSQSFVTEDAELRALDCMNVICHSGDDSSHNERDAWAELNDRVFAARQVV